MTYEKALERTKALGLHSDKERIKYLDIVIEALEKQIPKNPYFDPVSYNCPRCLHTVGMVYSFFPKTKELYCNACGQAIDWSDL